MTGVRTLQEFKEKEKEIKRNLIINAAVRVFGERPYDKISLQEIAEEAGLSKASIYTYFENRESLFVQAALRELDGMLDELRGIISRKKNPHLEDIINACLDYFLSHNSFFKMATLFITHGSLDPQACLNINVTLHHVISFFESLFKDMGYKGDTRILSHTLMAALDGILITYEKSAGKNAQEKERHMKRVGSTLSRMFVCLIENNQKPV